jgi:hypothetical protein
MAGSGGGSGSVGQRHGSADPDPLEKKSRIRNTVRRHTRIDQSTSCSNHYETVPFRSFPPIVLDPDPDPDQSINFIF